MIHANVLRPLSVLGTMQERSALLGLNDVAGGGAKTLGPQTNLLRTGVSVCIVCMPVSRAMGPW